MRKAAELPRTNGPVQGGKARSIKAPPNPAQKNDAAGAPRGYG